MARATNLLGTVALLSLVVALPGCNSGKTVRVWGEVKYAGQPLENGTIVFTPIDGTDGPSTGAKITTGKYDIPADKGAMRGGSYKVEITSLRKNGETIPNLKDPKNGPPEELSEQFLPAEFNTDSKLRAKVEQSNSRIDFDLLPTS